jgi:polar amino acid transport system substrate-binding protein
MHLEMKAADILRELAPTGRIRLGIVVAPAASAFFAILEDGTYRGVTVDIGRTLAAHLCLDVEIVSFPNSGVCTEALEAGAIDVSFMPVDDERRERVAFGPAYYLIESTYLVTAASGIESLPEVDRAGVRVVGIANTTTIRSAGRSLTTIQPEPVETVVEGVERLLDGRADALALSRDAFRSLLPQLPGSRVLDGGFQRTGIAIATGKNRPAALALLSDFMEEAKANGLVRRALDAAGFADEPVAPLQA